MVSRLNRSATHPGTSATVAAGSGQKNATQPVGLVGGGFRPAGELKPGDRVWRWIGDEPQAAAVTAVTPTGREAEVLNLILGEPTGFIAGDFLVRCKPLAPVQP